MKIAVVIASASIGGFRYIHQILSSLKKNDPELDITIIHSKKLLDFFPQSKESLLPLMDIGIKLDDSLERKLFSKKFSKNQKFTNKILNELWQYLRKLKYKYTHRSQIPHNQDLFEGFDVVFYPWPYGINAPNTKKNIFYVPHDFIHTHFFGHHCGNVYSRDNYYHYYRQIYSFSQKGHAIVSSHYIKDEFERIFPSAPSPNVVYLSTLNRFLPHSDNEVSEVLQKYNIQCPYLLLPTNNTHHKNMGQVLGAYYYIKQTHPEVKLIITGTELEPMEAVCRTPYYMDHMMEQEKEWDIKILGLLNDEEFSMLMQNAKVVINASLIEAGNGSGLDAWQLGVPVAMSDIPPFRNQMEFLGVKAELFDPRNSQDIAHAILAILDNPTLAQENVKISKEAMARYIWDDVAKSYLQVFRKECDL